MGLFSQSSEFRLDVLKEIGNIGAGNAATALSRLLDKPVDMNVPTVSMVAFEEIADRVGGSEQVVIAIYLRVEGDAPGNLFFILSMASARKLLHQLLSMDLAPETPFTDMHYSALCEIGNILAGSYLSSLADFTRLMLTPTVPSLSIDMAGAILSFGLLQSGQMGDDALVIDTSFLDGQNKVEGHFFLIPDPDAFATIFHALGVPFE